MSGNVLKRISIFSVKHDVDYYDNQFKNNITSNNLLNRYGSNTHSQNGEDGIITEILLRLGLTKADNSWCVEFGAWDGMHLSNTFLLVELGWNVVQIEGDPIRYQDLFNLSKKFLTITPINAFVDRRSHEKNSLDKLLADTRIPIDFDLLSIDIDSYDCAVWQSLKNYSPKIVVIEINSSAVPGIFWTHGYKTPGNTFSSILRVGIDKGYSLVCHSGNLIFVRNDLVSMLNFEDKYLDNPELLFMNSWVRENLYNFSFVGTHRILKTKGLFKDFLRKLLRYQK